MARAETFRDLYEILGTDREADPEALRAAYRERARELHPDVSDDPDAEAKFAELNQAYEVLSKPKSRLLYDRLAYRGPGGGGFGPVHETVGRPSPEDAHLSNDELAEWIFTEPEPELDGPVPREDNLVRYLAAAALVIAVLLLAVVLWEQFGA